MRAADLRILYRPAPDRLPRWLHRVWCWFQAVPGSPLSAGSARPGAAAAPIRFGRAHESAAAAVDSGPATGALRWVWHGRYGSMLIEVVAGEVFVNGDRVEPLKP